MKADLKSTGIHFEKLGKTMRSWDFLVNFFLIFIIIIIIIIVVEIHGF